MFSVASMLGSDSGDEEDDAFVERDHSFPGLVLGVCEFAFHQVNANFLWPGASIFAEWIVDHKMLFSGHRVLELGSGTGALAIFLKKTLELDITTSDYDDVEIENNISKNCHLNGLATLPHIRHTWGEDFPYATPDWDLVIASDILLYVKQFPNLIKTISNLLKGYKQRKPTHEDDTRASSSMEAQTMTIQLTSVQVQVLMGIESVGSGGLLIGQCCAHFGRTSITRNTPTCLNLRASRPLFLPVPGFRV